jgi:hypothetical protein
MKKWQKIPVLCAAAALLPFAAFEQRAEPARCVYDVCNPDWSKGLILAGSFVDVVASTGQVFQPERAPSNTSLRQAYEGIYARGAIPVPLALFFGLVLPILLLALAGFLALSGRDRDLTKRRPAPT